MVPVIKTGVRRLRSGPASARFPSLGSSSAFLTPKDIAMARKNNGNGGGIVAALLLGAGLLVLQDLLKDETESWLKQNGLWPK